MKRFSFFTVLMVLCVASALAGGDGSCKSNGKKVAYKKCSADTQTCLNKMTSKMSQMSWDGIYVEGIAAGEQVVVKNVVEDSPGAKAGIQAGDVLVAMNGKKLADLDPKAFNKTMAAVKIGEEVTYKVKRGQEWLKVSLAMTAMPKKEAATQVGWHLMSGHASEGEQVASY